MSAGRAAGRGALWGERDRDALRVGGLVPRLQEDGPQRVACGGDPVPAALVVRGPVEGWGGCSIEPVGEGAPASFRIALVPADPLLAALAQGAAARGTARTHLKRSLSRLGRLVAGEDARVTVGTVVERRQPAAPLHAGNCIGAGFGNTRPRRAG